MSAAGEPDAVTGRHGRAWGPSLRLVGYARRRWPAAAAVLATTGLSVALNVLKPWPMKVLVDYVWADRAAPAELARWLELLPGGSDRNGLMIWTILGTVAIFLTSSLIGLASGVANLRFGQRMVYDLARDVFTHLNRLSLRYHARRSTGDLIRRVSDDCGCVSAAVKDALLPMASSVLTLGAIVLVMWRIDRALTLVALATMPALFAVLRGFAGPMMDRSYEQQTAEGKFYESVGRTFGVIPVVQAFSREAHHDRAFRRTTDDALAAALSATDVQLHFKIATGAVTTLGTAAVIWIGSRHALAGDLSFGSILVFLAYLGSLYGPLESLVYAAFGLSAASGSARRVVEVLEEPAEIADRPSARPLATCHGLVEIDRVSVGYEPGRPVLHDVSLTVRPGEMVALVGASGAGKSTLASLLPRFLDPWSGRVMLDGHDLRDLTLTSVRRHVSLVLQEPLLLPTTIGQNIAYGRPNATAEDIEAAARAANLDEMIAALPLGYDTPVGTRGTMLSGGQRQLVTIARAILRDAPVLILDEPTSSLDARTEARVVDALTRLMSTRTTIVIAHRLSTVRRASRILVMDGGAIVESGAHEALAAAGGPYARMLGREPEPATQEAT